MRHYSHLFSCLYDEPKPVGDIGRGSHYSVFRTVQWQAKSASELPTSSIHDFAVIWDEDHDERVIEAIERLHMASLLIPVLFIGERKGNLTILVDRKRFQAWEGVSTLNAYETEIQTKVNDILGDHWPAGVGTFDRGAITFSDTAAGSIINDKAGKVGTYLSNIQNLWDLGIKPYRPAETPDDPELILPVIIDL